MSEEYNLKGDNPNPDLQNEVLTREVVESFGNKVLLVDCDKENNLDLFCYIKCLENDAELLKQCRGVVFHDSEIVLRGFPYAPEYNDTEEEKIKKLLVNNFRTYKFFDSHEGALIRVFNFSGKWYISTHRKLDAFRSKWASKESFGTMFLNALEAEYLINENLRKKIETKESDDDSILTTFLRTLDTDKRYMFLVRNTAQNRIVSEAPRRATIYHVGTFIGETLVFNDYVDLPYPQEYKFTSAKELVNCVHNMDPRSLQGVIIFAPNNKQYKILNKDYQELFNVRGNEPSIKFRYLQIRLDIQATDNLFFLYPDKAHIFDDYENVIYEIAKHINRAYVDRYIKRQFVTVPKEEYHIMKTCHEWHLKDRKRNRISFQKVMEVINEQTPTFLNHMIRKAKTSKIESSVKIPHLLPRPSTNENENENENVED